MPPLKLTSEVSNWSPLATIGQILAPFSCPFLYFTTGRYIDYLIPPPAGNPAPCGVQSIVY